MEYWIILQKELFWGDSGVPNSILLLWLPNYECKHV